MRDRYVVFDGVKFEVITVSMRPTLSCMQDKVGGLIEPLFTEPMGKMEITGYVNEEGWILDLPASSLLIVWPNGSEGVVRFAGNLLIVGLDPRTGKTILLTEDEVNNLLIESDNFVLHLDRF